MSALKVVVTSEQKYPMCEKLNGVSVERRLLENFMEWLQEKHGSAEVFDLHSTRVVFEYLEIDQGQLEVERRAILEEQRKKNDEQRDE